MRREIVRFGVFELDQRAGELRKNGLKVRLQDQPLQLLSALVERPGEVVTREELKEKLWPADTYVDFDRSLNTAASRLRDALGDSASSPRFVETLPKRGYRFLGAVDAPEPPIRERESSRRLRVAWSVAALAALAVGALLLVQFRDRSPHRAEGPLRRFTVTPPGGFIQTSPWVDVAISPNGKHIAYSSAESRKLGILDLERGQHRLIEGSEEAVGPFWSPDSQFIGFNSGREIRTAPVDGGAATRICELPTEWFMGASWSPDGEWIVFSSSTLYEVPARGGVPRPLVAPADLEAEPQTQRMTFGNPRFLPAEAGKRVLAYQARTSTGSTLVIQDLDTGRRETLGDERKPVYSPSGHIIYRDSGRDAGLWAVPFSLSSLKATGEPFPISSDGDEPTVADDQTLVYVGFAGSERLAWFDRHGEQIGEIGQPQPRIWSPELSPDEGRVAVVGSEGDVRDVWIHEVGRDIRSPLTSTYFGESRPIWSSSGREIVFSSSRDNKPMAIYRKAANGTGETELLRSGDTHEYASDLSRDDRYLLYDRDGKDIWYLERTGDGGFEAKPFLATQFMEKAAVFSPDGGWVSYVSNEAGEFEVYVRRFPEGDRKQRISENGGMQVRWSRDGRRLYYVGGETLFEVEVRPGAELAIGNPKPVFHSPVLRRRGISAYPRYDVSADGQRFVVSVGESREVIHVVQNWFAEFRDPEGAAE